MNISERRAHHEAIKAKCFHPSGAFVEFPKEDVQQSIPSRFDYIVSRYPDRIAVKAARRTLTYAELNAVANQVAHTVLEHTECEERPVALLIEKGVAQIAAMIGVLKAGKFFVLLDPAFPNRRIVSILEDSGAKLLLTNGQNSELAQQLASSERPVINLDSIARDTPERNIVLLSSSQAVAYVSYTSGSTGQPKGVIQTHRNVLHDVMLRTNAYHIGAEDRLSLLASGTSHAIKNIFLTLLNGATLLPFDVQKEGAVRLAVWLSEERVSICRISSPLFRRLCENLKETNEFPDLRLIVLASETIYKSDVELYKKHFSTSCFVATGVSSTETGIMRDYLIDHNTHITTAEVPVGYSVEGKEVLLLDDTGREVGPDEIGEIAVRSLYVSPGYWRRPELTSNKFRPNQSDPNKSLYLTGDLGSMLPDGCLLHKGRKDFRVKIRGYSVEIPEIESALSSHPAVANIIVTPRLDESGETRLSAYFTAATAPPATVTELQRFLRQKFPDYMIPSAFVLLDSFPLTAAGKIDRQALPAPGRARPRLDTPFVAPRTETERRLARIWTEVLTIDMIGARDNFFDLGGHSLAAARVVSRIVKEFDSDLPIESLFQSPTLAELAAEIATAKTRQTEEKDLNSILSELESLSDDQAGQLLTGKATRPDR